jgi:DNA (cytosine-5)-methyltransferase 1
MTRRLVNCADLFCGAGGTSTGLANACRELGLDLDLIAVNHWQVAIDTHTKNHPNAKHLCARLEAVEPQDHVPGGRLALLVASPECTHHSRARGGKPMSDQSRASAWLVLKWLQELYVDNLLIENVKEFVEWGPLGVNGKPLKSKKGELFRAWIDAIRALGYTLEYRIINAADYGDATTRERFIMIAKRGNKRVTWPEPTHARNPQPVLFGIQKQRWRPAREIIDWSISGKSIFNRKKALAPATLDRIMAGIRKFRWPEPFIVLLRNHMDGRSLDEPLPTLTAGGQHVGIVQPFTIAAGGPEGKGRNPQSVDSPLGTVLTENHTGLVHAFVLGQQSGSVARQVNEPLPTVAGGGAISVVQPFMAELRSGKTANDVGHPLSTVTTKGAHHAVVEPFMIPFFGERPGQTPRTHSIDEPCPAITGHGAGAVVEPFVMPVNHGSRDKRSYSGSEPMPTITSVDAWSMVSPMLVEYYGTADARSVESPLGTVTGRDRFGLLTPDASLEPDRILIDILFRMLQPHELAAAMGYEGYHFTGTREQKVKQIGNGVPERMARALCREILQDRAPRRAVEACA